MTDDYRKFLEDKVCVAPRLGFDVEESEVNPLLKPHQRAIVRWMVAGGRRACFAAFGLGKTMMQLEAVRLTLNSSQHSKGREMHLCPLQFDIVDRMIVQCSNPGDVVFDPFAGLGTVPVRAIKHGRYGLGCELNARYFLDSCAYAKAEEDSFNMPDMFSVAEIPHAEAAA